MMVAGFGYVGAQTTVSFAEAVAAGQALGNNETSSTTYRTTGVVSQVTSSAAQVNLFHNCNFLIADPTSASSTSITCYRTKWLGNTNMASADMPAEGDTVTIVGPLQNYKGNTVEFYTGYIESISRLATVVVYDTIDVDVCGALTIGNALASGAYSSDYYRVSGVVDTITFSKESAMQQTFRMNCVTGSYFTAYNGIIAGSKLAGVGDTVVVLGRILNYNNGTIEISGGEVTIVGAYVAPIDTVTPQPTGITVGFLVPADWNDVYLHYWDTNKGSTNWPGVQVQKGENNWAYFTFENDSVVNYIWNSGSGIQTVDLHTDHSVCQRAGATGSGGQYLVVDAECGSAADTTAVQQTYDVTVAEALAVGAALGNNETTTDLYRVAGIVSSVVTWKNKIVEYGNCNFYIQPVDGDTTISLYCFKTNWLHNATFTYAEDIPVVGDTIVVLGPIQNYLNTTIEIARGYIESIARYVEPQPIDTTSHDTIPQPTAITLGFQAPAEWENVYIYSWNTQTSTGEWPGTMLTKDSLGWAYFTFDGDSEVNYLWNNGNGGAGNQTVNLLANCNKCERTGGIDADGLYVISFAECGSVIEPIIPDTTGHDTIPIPVVEPIVMRLSKASVEAAGWQSVGAFVWDNDYQEYFGAWPGTSVALDSTGNWYTVSINADFAPFNFIWNNGNGSGFNQTVDLLNITESECHSLRRGEINYNVAYVDCNTIDSLPSQDSVYYTLVFRMPWNMGNAVIDSLSVLAGQPAVLPEAPAVEGYRFAGWQAVADMSAIWSDMTITAYYELAYPDSVEARTPITIRLQASTVPASWEHVYLLTWDWSYGELPTNGGYGLELTADSTGWYTYTFDRAVTSIDFLFNNGEWGYGNQTVDVNNLTSSYCLQIGAPLVDSTSYHMVYLTDCGFDPYVPVDPVPEDSRITVRLLKPAFGWDHVYLFAWPNNDSIGMWPGIELTPDSLGWCSYTFPYDTVVNIIWNDGITNGNLLHQTQNIDGLNHSADFRLNGWYWNSDRQANMTYAEELPQGANPADYHTVAFLDMDFDNNLILIQQVLHGSLMGMLPGGPTHDGWVFKYWIYIDPVTMSSTSQQVLSSDTVMTDVLIDELYDRATYTVFLVDWNGTIFAYSHNFGHGGSMNWEGWGHPEREGYEFIGWSDSLQNVTSDRVGVALYKPVSEGNYAITYANKEGQFLDTQNVNLNVPAAPVVEGFTFIGWQVVAGSLENGITIQATYQANSGTNAPKVDAEGQAAHKEFRQGIIYVIKPDGSIYTTAGQRVK